MQSLSRVYYGWVIVAGLMAVGAVSTGMGGINLGLFIEPMRDELDIGTSVFGIASTARLAGFALAGWIVGRILDRRGARLPLAIAGLMAGGAMLAMSQVTAGWQIVVIFFIVGCTGLQGGAGSLFMSVPLATWFIRGRGKAISLAFMGIPIGIFIFSPLSQLLIDEIGWRDSWLILGGGGALVTVLVALLIIRRRPQDMGLLPDGDIQPREDGSGIGSRTHSFEGEVSWTREEAIRSSTFWRLAGVDGLRMLAMSSVGIFRIPYFIDDKGFDASIVAWSLSAEAVFAVLVALPTGWAVDRYQPRYVAAVSTMLMVAGFILTMTASSIPMVFAATSVFGLGVASFIVCQNSVWPAYFGHAHLGSIRGFATPLMLVFSAIGAPATGVIHDATGSYQLAWIVGTIGLVLAALLLLVTPKPSALPLERGRDGQPATTPG